MLQWPTENSKLIEHSKARNETEDFVLQQNPMLSWVHTVYIPSNRAWKWPWTVSGESELKFCGPSLRLGILFGMFRSYLIYVPISKKPQLIHKQ